MPTFIDTLLGRTSEVRTVNPATGEHEVTFELTSDEQLDYILDQSTAAFKEWRKTSFADRSALMKKVAAEFRKQRSELARLATKEMGKLYKESLEEVDVCIEILEYYAKNAKDFLKDRPIDTERGKAFVSYEPMGVILSVQPWNFPYYQVIRNVAPNLMAGNVCILKHAENVPQCAGAIQTIFNRSGFPEGVFTNIYLEGPKTSDLAKDDRISGVTFTGSEDAGSSLAQVAGEHIKKVLLELGGSDAFIVLDDADIDKAVEMAAMGRLENAGQICTSPKRIIVMNSVKDEFIAKAHEMYMNVRIGDPMDEKTQLAPLNSESQLKTVIKQIDDSIDEGARLVYGGNRIEDLKGWYLQPTILTDIPADAPAYKDEIFGPVLCVYGVENEEEAIDLANDNRHGLGGSVISKSQKRAIEVARQMETGMVAINDVMGLYAEIPFGGAKKSGFGRELGKAGIFEFVNPKTIHAPGATASKSSK